MVLRMQQAKFPATAPTSITRAQQLLNLEAEMRRQTTFDALSLWAVNEPRPVLSFAQAIFVCINKPGNPVATAISSLPKVDRNAPFVHALEKRLAREVAQQKTGTPPEGIARQPVVLFDLVTQSGNEAEQGELVYPFAKAMMALLRDRKGKVFALYVVTRKKPWSSAEQTVFDHLSQALGHNLLALAPRRGLRPFALKTGTMAAIAAGVVLAMFIPVSMTTLAPAEIIADDPVVVTAPIDGVVRRIPRAPNSAVKKGDVLIEFDTTALEAGAEVARRREWVAEARLATARSTAFSDNTANRELAIARADVDLARAERRFAEQNLARAQVIASSPGHLIYSARKDWIGRPVKVGEQVMEIADLKRVAVRIDLPVSDAIALKTGAPVRLFMDSNPLSPFQGHIRRASYDVRERAGVGLVYEVIANLRVDNTGPTPRIGLRGTAQISGEKVALGYFLFRKPIASLRQFFGI